MRLTHAERRHVFDSKTKDVVDHLARLLFFRHQYINQELVQEYGIIPFKNTPENQRLCNSISNFQRNFMTVIRKYLQETVQQEQRRKVLTRLEDMSETERKHFWTGYWEGGPKKVAMAMWKPVQAVINWGVIFSPPAEASERDQIVCRRWRHYLRDCFVRSAEFYSNAELYGKTKNFSKYWYEMVEHEDFSKPLSIYLVPVYGSMEMLQWT
ncbi:MAG: hypothetical protein M1822_004700 [Bathelium mastoideum]|nr:MAG: hypothetical protein M1822_004700 [Bathelium mastoideum]